MGACMHSTWKCAYNLGQKTNPHLSQMKSDLYKTFSVCQDWSPVMITNVLHRHACTHRVWILACNLGQKTNPHISAKWSQIFMKPSVYVKIGSLSWLIISNGVYMCACRHSAWKRSCNLRQKNPHISSKRGQIFTKRSWYVKIGLLCLLILFMGVHMHASDF